MGEWLREGMRRSRRTERSVNADVPRPSGRERRPGGSRDVRAKRFRRDEGDSERLSGGGRSLVELAFGPSSEEFQLPTRQPQEQAGHPDRVMLLLGSADRVQEIAFEFDDLIVRETVEDLAGVQSFERRSADGRGRWSGGLSVGVFPVGPRPRLLLRRARRLRTASTGRGAESQDGRREVIRLLPRRLLGRGWQFGERLPKHLEKLRETGLLRFPSDQAASDRNHPTHGDHSGVSGMAASRLRPRRQPQAPRSQVQRIPPRPRVRSCGTTASPPWNAPSLAARVEQRRRSSFNARPAQLQSSDQSAPLQRERQPATGVPRDSEPQPVRSIRPFLFAQIA